MALRKGLGGCWAEGDSLSGMAVHYTMVTRSGLGSGGPLLLTSGGAVVARRWCGRVVCLPGCWCGLTGTCSAGRCHPATLSMSHHSAITRLVTASLHWRHHLCTSVLTVTVSVSWLQCICVWMLPGARCLANYRSMSQSYIPLRRPARPSPAWATDRPVSARGAAARPATSHQGGAGRGGCETNNSTSDCCPIIPNLVTAASWQPGPIPSHDNTKC